MTVFQAFQMYLSVKLHFSGGYDYFKYGGKTPVSQKAFERRRDRIFFQKLSKHEDLLTFLVANMSENPKAWVKDLAYSREAEEKYAAWKKRQESLSYQVSSVLKGYSSLNEFKLAFEFVDGEHPKMLLEGLSGRLPLDVLAVLADATGAVAYWKKCADPVLGSLMLRVEKVVPFIEYNKKKIRALIVDTLSI